MTFIFHDCVHMGDLPSFGKFHHVRVKLDDSFWVRNHICTGMRTHHLSRPTRRRGAMLDKKKRRKISVQVFFISFSVSHFIISSPSVFFSFLKKTCESCSIITRSHKYTKKMEHQHIWLLLANPRQQPLYSIIPPVMYAVEAFSLIRGWVCVFLSATCSWLQPKDNGSSYGLLKASLDAHFLLPLLNFFALLAPSVSFLLSCVVE